VTNSSGEFLSSSFFLWLSTCDSRFSSFVRRRGTILYINPHWTRRLAQVVRQRRTVSTDLPPFLSLVLRARVIKIVSQLWYTDIHGWSRSSSVDKFLCCEYFHNVSTICYLKSLKIECCVTHTLNIIINKWYLNVVKKLFLFHVT